MPIISVATYGSNDATLANFMKQGGVSHCSLAIYIKRILRQKKNYQISNISPCKNIIFKKILYKKPKSFKIL
jgi:hypothetical protein